jgi:hypothetical protein
MAVENDCHVAEVKKPSLWERSLPKIKKFSKYYAIAHVAVGLLRFALLGDGIGVVGKGMWDYEHTGTSEDSYQIAVVLPYWQEHGIRAALSFVDFSDGPYISTHVMSGEKECAHGVGYILISPGLTEAYDVYCGPLDGGS